MEKVLDTGPSVGLGPVQGTKKAAVGGFEGYSANTAALENL